MMERKENTFSLTEKEAETVVKNKSLLLQLELEKAHKDSKMFYMTGDDLIESAKISLIQLVALTVTASVALVLGGGAMMGMEAYPQIVDSISNFLPIDVPNDVIMDSVAIAATLPASIPFTKVLFTALEDAKDDIEGAYQNRYDRKRANEIRRELVLELEKINNMPVMEAAEYILSKDSDVSKTHPYRYEMAPNPKLIYKLKKLTYKEKIAEEKRKFNINKKAEEYNQKADKLKKEYEKQLQKKAKTNANNNDRTK